VTTAPERVTILFLAANPAATDRLAIDREIREIAQRLRATPHGHLFDIAQEWALRREDLQAALLRHRPTIVHFSGHGRQMADGSRPAAGTRESRALSERVLEEALLWTGPDGVTRCLVASASNLALALHAQGQPAPATFACPAAAPDIGLSDAAAIEERA